MHGEQVYDTSILTTLNILSTPSWYGRINQISRKPCTNTYMYILLPFKPINVRQICADCDLFANLFTEHESDRDKTFPGGGGGKLHYSAILRVF